MTEKSKNLFFLLTSLILTLLATFRGNTRDTSLYIHYFESQNQFPSPFIIHHNEYFFVLLSYILNTLGLTYHSLFFFITITTFLSLFLIAKNFKIEPLFILPYYASGLFFTQQLMQIRQGIAIPLAFAGISFLIKDKRNYTLAIFFFISAFLFHYSSILPIFFGVIYFFIFCYKEEIFYSKNTKIAILILAVILYIAMIFISHFMANNNYTYLTNSNLIKIQNYFSNSDKLDIFSFGNLKLLIITVLICCFQFKFKFKFNKENYYFYFLVYIFFTGIYFRIVFREFDIIAGRLGNTLIFSEILLVPIILREFFKNKNHLFILFFLVFLVNFVFHIFFQYDYLLNDYFTKIEKYII